MEIKEVNYESQDEEDTYEKMGDYSTIMSSSQIFRQFTDISTIANGNGNGDDENNDNVWIRGRVHSIRIKCGSFILVLRQNPYDAMQATFFKQKGNDNDNDNTSAEHSQKMIRYLKQLSLESKIDTKGTIVPANVKSCTIDNVEIQIDRVYGVSKANPILPFLVEDAARSEAEIESSQDTDRPHPRLGQEL